MVLQPYFVLPDDVKWREQELDVIIGLPLGAKIFLDESLDKLIHNVENNENLWSDEMLGEAWIMTEEGLSRTIEDTER